MMGAAARWAVAACLAAVGSAVLQTPTSNLSMFKRTHASCRAYDDGDFAAFKLGMLVSVNVSYYCNAGTQFIGHEPCAERVVATVLGNFEFHYYQSHVTPQMNVTTCDFADAFLAANDYSDAAFEWTEWTHQGSSHYVPVLDAHLKLWASDGIHYLGRRYVDGDGAVVYSARVVVPGSGHVVEIVSGNVSATSAGTFTAYEAGECGGANEHAATVAEMEAAWSAQLGVLVNLYGLPDLLPLRVAQPSTDAAAFPEFLEAHSSQHLNTSIHHVLTDKESCTWTRATINIGATLGGWAMDVVSIHNRYAAKSGYNVSFFESYVTAAQDELLACDGGYARYIDNHVGISLGGPEGITLDANAESLCRHDVGFHNGNDSYDWGSNWCRGESGLGVEFQGNYDYSFFEPQNVFTLDYCAALGKGSSDDFCKFNLTAISNSSPATWWEENWPLVATLVGVAVFCCCFAAAVLYWCGYCAGDASGAGYSRL